MVQPQEPLRYLLLFNLKDFPKSYIKDVTRL